MLILTAACSLAHKVMSNDKWQLGSGVIPSPASDEWVWPDNWWNDLDMFTHNVTSKVMTSDLTLQQRLPSRHCFSAPRVTWPRRLCGEMHGKEQIFLCCCSLIDLSRDNYISDVMLWCCQLLYIFKDAPNDFHILDIVTHRVYDL